MIEAIGAIGHVAAGSSPMARDAAPALETPAALQQPTQAQASEFARLAGGPGPLETAAAPPAASDGLSARLASQADRLSSHLQALAPQSAAETSGPATSGHAFGDARGQMTEAVAQIERAYMFAIETTMASRGSTETTKIFNTLLKGQ